MSMDDFGALVRTAREQRRMRSYDLAYALGLTPSWVSKLERGDLTHPPAPTVLAGLSRCLGLSQVEMLEEIGYSVREPGSPATGTRRLTPATRAAMQQIIENVNTLMEEMDPTDPDILEDEDDESGEATG